MIPDREIVVVLCLLLGFLTTALAAKSISPHEILSHSYDMVSMGVGSGECKNFFKKGSSGFKYRLPRHKLSHKHTTSIPPESFSVGTNTCAGDKPANVIFALGIKAPSASDTSAFAYTLRELLRPEDPTGAVFEMIIGKAGTGSESAPSNTAPRCKTDIGGTDQLSLRNILLARAVGDSRSRTPVPDEFLVIRAGYMYAMVNLIPISGDGNSMICIFSSTRPVWNNSTFVEKSQSQPNITTSHTPEMGLKIAIGVIGIVIALVVILTGACFWRKHTPLSDSGTVLGYEDDICITPEHSAA